MNLEPGPELDLDSRVSLAIDRCPYADKLCGWSPSTDANVALKAAKACELFPRDGMRFLRIAEDGLWNVVEIYTNTPYEAYVIGEGATMSLAICEAILELKEQP